MARIKWIENLKFIAKGNSEHSIILDTKKEFGGENSAPSPMEYILFGLGGCTGMDVVSILKKMNYKIDEFYIDIEAERKEEHPKIYKNIKITYNVKGDIPLEKIEHAVKLSQEKYCSVSAMLSKATKIVYEIKKLE